jgi:hypothetical protein
MAAPDTESGFSTSDLAKPVEGGDRVLADVQGRFFEALKGDLPADPEISGAQQRRLELQKFMDGEAAQNRERVANGDIGPEFALSEGFIAAAHGHQQESEAREVAALIRSGEDPLDFRSVENLKEGAEESFAHGDAWMRIFNGEGTHDDARLAFGRIKNEQAAVDAITELRAETVRELTDFKETFGFALPYQRLEIGYTDEDEGRLKLLKEKLGEIRKEMRHDRKTPLWKRTETYGPRVQTVFEILAPNDKRRGEITLDFENGMKDRPDGQDPLGKRYGRDRSELPNREREKELRDQAREARERRLREQRAREDRSRTRARQDRTR